MNKQNITRRKLIASLSGLALYTVVEVLKRPRHYGGVDNNFRYKEPIKPLKTEGMIAEFGLPHFIEYWNREVLSRIRHASYPLDKIQQNVLKRDSIFLPPASADEIAALQKRIGIPLPPSLIAFLSITNGVMSIVDYSGIDVDLYPTAQIGWLNEQDPNLVNDWTGAMKDVSEVSNSEYFQYGPTQDPVKIRDEYLKHIIALGPVVDSGVFLINPQIIFPNGEWEAWDFSVKYPGAKRYKSLNELLEAFCSSSCENLDFWNDLYITNAAKHKSK
ncbi:MAG: SMI1/KNR4 family protein [Gammaproteobacteria bacterium]|nr:SMI1/KNR4 family protein [Gammaproteobacteria bacterium]